MVLALKREGVIAAEELEVALTLYWRNGAVWWPYV
jgi:hypothetical protein